MKLILLVSNIFLTISIQAAPTGIAAGLSGSLAIGGVKSAGLAGSGSTSGAVAGSFAESHSGAFSGVSSGQVDVVENVKPQKTYVERTVIPNYVEKTVYEPSYVEKTVRVPTVVAKKIKVPAQPTVIEKTITQPHDVEYGVAVEEEVQPVYVKKLKHRHHFHGHTLGGGYVAGYGGGYGGGSKAFSGSISHSVSPRLGEAIVNIPIATLQAVGGLLGTIAGGTSISGSFAKSGSYAY